jgi:DNA-directed RNA polymerase subunit RPC12/RpoP
MILGLQVGTGSQKDKKEDLVKKGEEPMRCPKCGGLMLMQSFFDHFINFEGWKCLNCGKIIEKRENTIKDDSFGIFYQRQKLKRQND